MTKKTADKPDKSAQQFPRWAIVTSIVIIIVAVIIVVAWLLVRNVYANTFAPGVTVGNIPLAGLSLEEGRAELEEAVAEADRSGWRFSFDDREIVLTPQVTAPSDPDLTYPIVDFDVTATLEEAYAIGRSGDVLTDAVNQFRGLVATVTVPMAATVYDELLQKALQENFGDADQPRQDAQLIVTKQTDEWQLSVQPEQTGSVLEYQAAIEQLRDRATRLQLGHITLNRTVDQPQVTTTAVESLFPQVRDVLDQDPLALTFAEEEWQLDATTMAPMLAVTSQQNQPTLTVDEQLFTAYVTKQVEDAVIQPVQEARFAISSGRVSEFQAAQTGRDIDWSVLLQQVTDQYLQGSTQSIALPVVEVEPAVSTDEVNDLGITELIGVGISDFSGSPVNRRHNIAVGADALNGILLAPGEEFSLLDALGEIDGANGYRQELVIKGDKTIPEYGGGLCQIGTTVFRATLDSGLPVTARRNHSYSVSYYYPAGTDATIYDPAPDYRFVNDTDHHVLIQTKIIGDELRFEFWGTKDGRTTSYSGTTTSSDFYDITPRTYNRISPPPTKYIETTDLEPGQKKCTERAHVGLTADFDYVVEYADGEVKETNFASTYRPWQEVCLIGVEEVSTPEEPAEPIGEEGEGEDEDEESNSDDEESEEITNDELPITN